MSDYVHYKNQLDEICPYCKVEDGCEHLLARVDRTFGEQGEGELQAGIVAGPVMQAVEILQITRAIRANWIEQLINSEKAPLAPAWMKPLIGISLYFNKLGSSGNFDIDTYDNDEAASDDLINYTDYHASAVRDIIEEHLYQCDWDEEITFWETGEFMTSSAMLTWWDLLPQARVDRLRIKLRETLDSIIKNTDNIQTRD